jgi:hypothetical protein
MGVRQKGAILAFLIVIPLAGCIDEQEKQTAACKVKALQTYPNDTVDGLSPSKRMAEFEQACMRAEGYSYTCGYDNLSDVSGCYEPSSQGGRWAYQAERWLKARGL